MARSIGAKISPRIERSLWMAIAPMLADVRATLPKITTPAQARALPGALKARYTDAKIEALVAKAGTAIEKAASMPWRQIDAAVRRARSRGDRLDAKEFDGVKLVDGWTREIAGLIGSVRDEAIDTMRRDIADALENGVEPSALAQRWIARGLPLKFGTLEGRSKVIAQTAVADLHERVRVTRAASLGITESTWRHSSQPSPPARAEHVALDGTRYENDKPPGGVRPGQLPNCRCWGESVIPDSLVKDLGIGAIFER